MKFSNLVIEGEDISVLIDIFRNAFSPSFVYTSQSGKMNIFILEEYKFWQDSDVAVIAMFDFETNNNCTITIVSAGGKTSILRLDLFGAEKSMVNKIETFFQALTKERKWNITFPPDAIL
ncbi:MAG: hypothetical protein HXS44_10905 [Theionarchaea archaeon]|nr:hypothetical protein [Theionarchaea archaeon]